MLKRLIISASVFVLAGAVSAAWLEGTQPLASRPLTPPVATSEIADDAITTAKISPEGIVGQVLTVTAGPDVQWAAPAAAPDADWTISGSNMYSAVSGNVGVGTTSPTKKLHVLYTGTAVDAIYSQVNNAASPSEALQGVTNGTGDAVLGLNTGTGRAGFFEVDNAANTNDALKCQTNGGGNAVVGNNYGTAGYAGFFVASGTATAALRASISNGNWAGSFNNSNNGRALQINNIMNLVPRTSAPASPTEGTVYVNSSSHHIYCYLNGAWKQLDN